MPKQSIASQKSRVSPLFGMGDLIPLGKVGENTWNARLTESLKQRGYSTADFELLYPTLRGLRKPDVVFSCQRGTAIVSGKLGATKEVDAIVSAQEYQQSLGQVTSLAEVFSLTYPAGPRESFHLRALATDYHSSIPWTLDSLQQVVEKVSEVINEDLKLALAGQESTISSAIRVLRKGVDELSSALLGIPLENIEAVFGGQDFFETSMESSGAKKGRSLEKRNRVLRSAAAYLFLNQVMFYELLARETKDYEPIAEKHYTQPDSLKPVYFDKVLLKDYRPIFAFDVGAQLHGKKFGDASRKIIMAIKALFPGVVNHDIVGKVFHDIIPLDVRKLVAAYYTNSQAGDLLAKLSIDNGDDLILDPACGSGTLLVSSYKRKWQIKGTELTEDMHTRFVGNDLTGIDIMAFSAHLAAVQLALMAPLYKTDIVRIAIEDSTTHKPGDTIASARDKIKEVFKSSRLDDYLEGASVAKPFRKKKTGAVSLNESASSAFVLTPVDVVIMNPPFTSCDNLPADYKTDLEKSFSSPEEYVACITGKLSFQAYFILLADRFLKKGGILACVLPNTTFTGKAFKPLINDFLLQKYTIRVIVFGLGRSAFSEKTSFTEILLVAKKKAPEDDHRFVLVGTRKDPKQWSDKDVDEVFNSIQEAEASGEDLDNQACVIKLRDQSALAQGEVGLVKLMSSLQKGDTATSQMLEEVFNQSGMMTSFSELERKLGTEIFAWELRIKGMAYYGFSGVSVVRRIERMKKNVDILLYRGEKKGKLLAENRFTKEKHEFPATNMIPCIRRLSDVTNIDMTGDTDFVISEHYDGVSKILKTMYPEDQLKTLESRLRGEWKAKVQHGLSKLCLARKIDLNGSGTRVLAVYSGEPAFLAADSWGFRGLDDDKSKVLALWFNSTLFIFDLLGKRTKVRGSWGRLDKRQITSMTAPDITRLDENQMNEALALFDEISKENFPSLAAQLAKNFWVRKKIDDFFLRLLGVRGKDERRRMQEVVVDSCRRHLEQMKATMEKD